MEWTQLKYAESHWDLSAAQKTQVAEAVLAQATAPRTFRLPFLKPILAVATLAVCAFALLLAWPKKPMEETVVTLPGASQEAKPDEYVPSENKEPIVQNAEKPSDKPAEEKEPAETATPDKEEPADPKEPADENVENTPVIHRFWETEKEMPYEEAVAIVKDKLENRFNEPLTDKERMAYYQCISTYFSKIYNFNQEHSNMKVWQSNIHLRAITTKDGIGLNLRDMIAELPQQYPIIDGEFIVSETNKMKSYDQVTPISDYATRVDVGIMEKEDGYYGASQNTDLYQYGIDAKGCGQYRHYFHFSKYDLNESEIPKEAFDEVIRRYLSVDSVIWVELSLEFKPEHRDTIIK